MYACDVYVHEDRCLCMSTVKHHTVGLIMNNTVAREQLNPESITALILFEPPHHSPTHSLTRHPDVTCAFRSTTKRSKAPFLSFCTTHSTLANPLTPRVACSANWPRKWAPSRPKTMPKWCWPIQLMPTNFLRLDQTG